MEGDVPRGGSKPKPLEKRFWRRINKDGPTPAHAPDLGPCWVFLGAKVRYGYGAFVVQRDGVREHSTAHRVSWVLAHGDIPDGMWVLHRCDNPPCVNPAHLFLGTRDDNMRDAMSKGRMARGSRAGRAKLTESDVRVMRALRGEGWTQVRLAERFGICQSEVSNVLRGATWRHVHD
jgi:hypothetical protein